jgi:hypothetical protein
MATKADTETPAKDLDKFQGLVNDFVDGLLSDVTYATSMIKKANAILDKRELWSYRLRYRDLAGHRTKAYEATGWSLKDAVELMESYLDGYSDAHSTTEVPGDCKPQ